MNPFLYVTQVTPTPTPVPTPIMINQWFIGGVGPFTDADVFVMVVVCGFLFVFALIVFASVEIE